MINLIDRYILKQFVFTLLFSLMSLIVIFVIVHLLENLDDFLDNNASIIVISEYYIYLIPGILKLITPVAMLLGTLFSIGKLSNQNEITAMKSGGSSLYKLMLPIIIFSVFISFGQLYFNGWVVPEANKQKIEIEQKFLNKSKRGSTIYNLYFRDTPLRILTMQYYNSTTKTGSRAAVELYGNEIRPRLKSRIEGETIKWDSASSKWILIKGIQRIYHGKSVSSMCFDSLATDIELSHDQIIQLKKQPEEMNFDELGEYISLMGRGGKDVRRQMADYYGQYAFPFANIIVVLFGVPFASVRKKGGIALQIGSAMIISFFYLIFTKVGQTIGYSYDFDPVISGWFANIVFLFIGLIVIFRTRT